MQNAAAHAQVGLQWGQQLKVLHNGGSYNSSWRPFTNCTLYLPWQTNDEQVDFEQRVCRVSLQALPLPGGLYGEGHPGTTTGISDC